MVRVDCMTYNHADYILDTLHGFTMQETNFPFVCTIVDDSSTDGEPEVILKYISNYFLPPSRIDETDDYNIICAQHKTNYNCTFVVILLKYNHYSIKKSKTPYFSEWANNAKYHAVCEGDDYWINSVKLQKQVDYMESHPDVSLCGTNGYTVWDKGVKPISYFNNIFESHIVQPNEVIGNWLFPTPSLLYRSELRENYPEWTKKIYSGDQTHILIALNKGNIYASADCTCVYRQNYSNPTSMSNKARADKNSVLFYYSQQILLYNEFSKYSNGKFDQWIRPTIKQLKKHYNFFHIRRKSKILASLVYPSIALEIVKRKLKECIK